MHLISQKRKDPFIGRHIYINDLLKVIKTFFRYAQKEEYIQVNPAESIKNVKQPKVKIITFSELEIRRMLGHYHGRDYLSVRNRTLLALFFDTGMRLNEVITLCADQIRDEYILVHGKGNKERLVPVSPYLAKALMQFQSVRHGYFDDRIHEKYHRSKITKRELLHLSDGSHHQVLR